MSMGIVIALGGVGIFLLGMVILTDGLKQLSGDALRRALAERTRTPLRGAITGAITTAIIQSSSATTVTAVGFVGAGLLTFSQGLGIVFGANIGTTMTGWLVAILGFKLKVGALAMPLIFLGALTRLFGQGRLRSAGWALAGFGLLFVGIDTMQAGLAPFEGILTPESFPEDTLTGRFKLVLIGVAITVVTQSSSAGVAAALVTLHAGAISFPQAAAMVIGMDVGTTFTAALATVGGSTAMRQTGYAHVIYNLVTGVMAFFLLGAYMAVLDAWLAGGVNGNAQLSLVGFHTMFNLVGILLIVPFAGPFARLVVKLVPERGPRLIDRLDDGMLAHPSVAVDAAAATLRAILGIQLSSLIHVLPPENGQRSSAIAETLGRALDSVRSYVARIRTGPEDPAVNARHEAAMHALDHAQRLHHRTTQEARIAAVAEDRRLARIAGLVREGARRLSENSEPATTEAWLDRLRALVRRQRRAVRARTVDAAAEQRLDAEQTLRRLDAARWLHRVAYHLWRLQHHLNRAEHVSAPPEAPPVDMDDD